MLGHRIQLRESVNRNNLVNDTALCLVTQTQNYTDEDGPSASFPLHDFQRRADLTALAEHNTSHQSRGQNIFTSDGKFFGDGSDGLVVALPGGLWHVGGFSTLCQVNEPMFSYKDSASAEILVVSFHLHCPAGPCSSPRTVYLPATSLSSHIPFPASHFPPIPSTRYCFTILNYLQFRVRVLYHLWDFAPATSWVPFPFLHLVPGPPQPLTSMP